jgi:hypothetical protein
MGSGHRCAAPSAIGFDEFPAGYSLAGCSPAEPGFRFPDRNPSSRTLGRRYKDFLANDDPLLARVSVPETSLF